MHKHKRYKHGHFPGGGMIWWFIFAMIFTQGDWWPWLLIAGGFWMFFGSMFDEEKPEKKNPPVSDFDSTPAPVVTKPAFTPTEQIHNAALLPATCSKCGGPISPYEVKWTGAQSASCPYCGSGL
jgi:hypothetical protein